MATSKTAEVILGFLVEENRPFAINAIVEKCGRNFNKALVQKTLDSLVETRKVTEKSIGKQKIYYATQTMGPLEHIKEFSSVQQKLLQTLKRREIEYRELEVTLNDIAKVRSLQCLAEERAKLMDEIRQANEELKRHEIVAGKAKINSDGAEKIAKRYEEVAKAYRKRKRICNDMLDGILEGCRKSKRQLIEEIGVETDEEIGFDITMYEQ